MKQNIKLINKKESTGLKHSSDSKAFINTRMCEQYL